MAGTADITVYSTSTDGEPNFDSISPELFDELELEPKDDTPEDFYAHHDDGDYEYFGNYHARGLPSQSLDDFDTADESDFYDEWCFVCSRATDHRGEHDDLVASGRAHYGVGSSRMVYRDR